jgi:hypothetical protein
MTAQEIEESGFTAEDFASETLDVWPEHWAACDLFVYLSTQWRTLGNGPSGLDYNVMDRRLCRMALAPDEYDILESQVQTIERAALACIHKKR